MDRHGLLKRALILSASSIAISGILGGLAVAAGVASNSLSLLGFGVDAAIDAVASIALFWRFQTEARAPHRAERIERIAETVVGGALLALAAYLVLGAIVALVTNAHPEQSTARIVLLVAAVTILPPLAVAKYRVARRLASGALRADSVLTAVAAVLASIGLAALALDVLGLAWADAAGALIVALVVAREGLASIRAVRHSDPITG